MAWEVDKISTYREIHRFSAADLDGGMEHEIVTTVPFTLSDMGKVFIDWYPDKGTMTGAILPEIDDPVATGGFLHVTVRNNATPGNSADGRIEILLKV